MRTGTFLASPSPWRCLCRDNHEVNREEVIVARTLLQKRREKDTNSQNTTCTYVLLGGLWLRAPHNNFSLSLIFYLAALNEFRVEPSNTYKQPYLLSDPTSNRCKKQSSLCTIFIFDLSCFNIWKEIIGHRFLH